MGTRIKTFLKSIKGKILLSTSSAVILVSIAIVSVVGTGYYRTLRQAHESLVLENVDTAELSIEERNNETLSLARTMVQGQESGLFGRRRESIEYAKDILVENPQITATFLAYEPSADQDDAAYLRQAGDGTSGLDAHGRFLPRWGRDFRDPNSIELQILADVDTNLAYQGVKDLFSSGASQRYVITEPHASRSSGKVVVDAVYPIVINGKFVGAAGVVSTLVSFRERLRYLETPYETAEFFLISQQGRIIATTLNPQLELEHVEDGIYAKVLGIFHHEKAVRQLRILTDPVEQETCYYAGEFIPTGGWMVVLRVSEREILAPIWQATGRAVGVSALGVLLTLGAVVWMANSISRPISAAIAVAERVASGDLTARAALTSDGETGQLLNAISAMTHSLNTLVGQVQLSSASLGSTTAHIAATARQQATTAKEASAFTKEIMTSTQEISTTSQEFAQIAKDISKVAAENAALAGTGRNGLASMENTMRQLLETDRTIAAKFTVLSEKASNINSVVTAITKVADQTNILSLNAAIEAEKAGEYGRGFAVVAREIRRLADQTAVATLDIERMVKEMQTAVSAGVTGLSVLTEEVHRGYTEVGKVNAQLAQIIEQMQTLAPRLATLNQGVQSQSTSAQRISESMVQLGTVTQQIADALHETDQALGLLSEEAQALREEIARFKVNLLE